MTIEPITLQDRLDNNHDGPHREIVAIYQDHEGDLHAGEVHTKIHEKLTVKETEKFIKELSNDEILKNADGFGYFTLNNLNTLVAFRITL